MSEEDQPRLAIVVVASQAPDGWRFLLLHPSDVVGDDVDWAWVPPGGRREPEEDPATCAARELEEETGIRGRPHPVKAEDSEIAVFWQVVPWPTTVRLSFEHDRFEWLPLDEARIRCRPAIAAESFQRAVDAMPRA
jgi:8-oxo-dGTP pyrophosphatase MutT (NUDIX family)